MLDASYRVVLLGGANVGKTALSIQMVCNNFIENVSRICRFNTFSTTDHVASMTLQLKICIERTSL